MTRDASGSLVRRALIGMALGGLIAGSAAAAVDHAAAPSPAQHKAARLADQAAAAADANEAWKALALLRKAATLAPHDARYRGALGRAYLAVNLYGSAAASFGDALALDAADGASQRGWAVAQRALGHSDVRYAGTSTAATESYRTASVE